jgi:2-oxoglutarate ferredoxin oxidoreductase subunit alpha
MRLAAADGVSARLVSLRLLAPLPVPQLLVALAGAERVVVIEQNHTAQLYRYLRAECDLPGTVTSLHRPGALQFSPGEIRRHLLEWSRA